MLIGALEAGGTKMVCSIGTPQGGVLQRASFPTAAPEVTVPQIVDFISKFDVEALGIGSFGPLDLNPESPIRRRPAGPAIRCCRRCASSWACPRRLTRT